tara:strand:+ start:11872 stop:12285 length:414 start_codon:yes stop_codon:yes gene_type:complete
MELHNSLKFSRAISPQTQTNADTPLVSQILDCAGFEANELVIQTGGLTDVDATFTVLLEESAASDMSGANAVDDADLLGTEAAASFTFANDDVVRKLGYKGIKRYIRATITPSGNGAGAAPLAAVWVQGGSRVKPQA